jgi:hypothetical protein
MHISELFQSAAVKLPAVLNGMLPACGGVTHRRSYEVRFPA